MADPTKPQVLPISPRQQSSMEQLLKLVVTDVPKLPEHLFISHILPILTDTSGQADMSNWLDVAGSLNRAIDVVDGGGQVLFRVPALQRPLTTYVSRHRPGKVNVAALAQRVELQTNQSPIAAGKMLEAGLKQAVPDTALELEPIHQLNAIFRRYNLPEIPLKAEAKKVEESEQLSAGFTGEFDDL